MTTRRQWRIASIGVVRVLEIWRYPVKSLQGERVDVVEAGGQGLAGDRRWALFDTGTGFGLTARRHPELLFASARLVDDEQVTITLPDGSTAEDDAALSRWLERPVELRDASWDGERRYENPADFENERDGAWSPFEGGHGAFHDGEGLTVSLLSTASIGRWDRRRFRANLLVEGAGEDDLVGHEVGVGDAVLAVAERIPRCVMTTRPQPDGIGRDLDVLRTLHRVRGGLLAVGASVRQPGRVAVGDLVGLATAG